MIYNFWKPIIVALILLVIRANIVLGEVPAWVLEAKNIDNISGTLYGNGSGRSIEQAKDNALADLSKFLTTTVSSSNYSQETISRGDNNQQTSNFRQSVATSSKKITIIGATTDKSVYVDGIYYLRVQVLGSKLAEDNTKIISTTNQLLSNQLDQLASLQSYTFDDVINLARLSSNIRNSKQALFILDALISIKDDLFFDISEKQKMENIFNDLLTKYQTILAGTKIIVKALKPNLNSFVELATEMFHEAGLKTIDEDKQLTDKDGWLLIDGQVTDSAFESAKIASVNLKLEIHNIKDVALGSKSYRVIQASPFSIEDAISKAASKWSLAFDDSNIIEDILKDD